MKAFLLLLLSTIAASADVLVYSGTSVESSPSAHSPPVRVNPLRTMPVKSALKLILLAIVAWAAGLVAYVASMAAFYRQSISHGDFVAVVVWSGAGFLLAFVIVYLPVLLGLRRFLGGVTPTWPFPLAAILLGVAPTAFVLFYWGGGLPSLFSSEASLFYSMFSVVGLLLGLGYVRIHAVCLLKCEGSAPFPPRK